MAPPFWLPGSTFQTHGSTDLPQLSEMLAAGYISADTLYWQNGMTDWRSVSELNSGG